MAGSGVTVTYGELDARSNRLAHLLRGAGLDVGDHVAIFMENHPTYFEVLWAALRSGLYLTPINRYLTVDEAAYILRDSGARALVTSGSMTDMATAILPMIPDCTVRLVVDGPVAGYDDYELGIAEHPETPSASQPRGDLMFYSSGTTGRPKGIKRPLTGESVDQQSPLTAGPQLLFGFDVDTVYLSTAPLYHTAPLGFCAATQAIGATVVCAEHFDPLEALATIEKYQVTHSQWVPTMFVRMLKTPADERARHDLSSMRTAIHAAAPCPRPIKEQMLAWWGPIIHEYYGGTEGNGLTYASPQDWIAHPGTVGRALSGIVHICDDNGADVATGESGTVYFEQPSMPFEYHNDPAKTRSSQHPEHHNWSTLGDVGHLDDEGFLYLTDRKAFMIISGGVNIYPQEIEDCLVLHPAVSDVAVFGVPDTDMGEAVKAVVQTVPGTVPTESLAQELITYCRAHLAGYKVPRSVDFAAELPRLPTGKLYKQVLRAPYWPETVN